MVLSKEQQPPSHYTALTETHRRHVRDSLVLESEQYPPGSMVILNQWTVRDLLTLQHDLVREWKQQNTTTSSTRTELQSTLQKHIATIFAPSTWKLQRIDQQQQQQENAIPLETLHQWLSRETVHSYDASNWQCRHHASKRIFGLFHHQLLDNDTNSDIGGPPSLLLHVSLHPFVPRRLTDIWHGPFLDTNTHSHTTACLYSISNLEPALSGLGLGEHLIHGAVAALQDELQSSVLPPLQTICTLSPMPGFRTWMNTDDDNDKEGGSGVDYKKKSLLVQQLEEHNDKVDETLLQWYALQYLCTQTNTSDNNNNNKKYIDGVARFHLGNGASIYRLNCFADTTTYGYARSYGVMVNYLYDNMDQLDEYKAYNRTTPPTLHESMQRLLEQEVP